MHPDGVAEVVFDDPGRPVNVLTEGVMDGLARLVASLHEEASRGALSGVIFRSGKPNSFLAGADVGAMDSILTSAQGESVAKTGQEIFGRIAALPVPTLAMIHGACVGGGTELALACSRRIASNDPGTRLSLPEVRLGIVPAWGGTTRLPALVGLLPSLSILLTGRAVSTGEGKAIGLIDQVFPPEHFEEAARARALARSVFRTKGRRFRFRFRRSFPKGWLHYLPGVTGLLLRGARRRIQIETDGRMPAPLAIVEILEQTRARAGETTVERGLALEAKALGELLPSPVSRNLRHLFHVSQRARRSPAAVAAANSVATPSSASLYWIGGDNERAFVERIQREGFPLSWGRVEEVPSLKGGPASWILLASPEGLGPITPKLPPPWRAQLVGLGRPRNLPRSPLMEIVAGSGGGSHRGPILREVHGIVRALGGVPILTRGPDGQVARLIKAFEQTREQVDGDPEALACIRMILGLRALAEKQFQNASMVDLAMVLAELAPPWEGGPLRAAEAAGLATTLERLEWAEHTWGSTFTPPSILRSLVQEQKTLDTLDPWRAWYPSGDST